MLCCCVVLCCGNFYFALYCVVLLCCCVGGVAVLLPCASLLADAVGGGCLVALRVLLPSQWCCWTWLCVHTLFVVALPLSAALLFRTTCRGLLRCFAHLAVLVEMCVDNTRSRSSRPRTFHHSHTNTHTRTHAYNARMAIVGGCRRGTVTAHRRGPIHRVVLSGDSRTKAVSVCLFCRVGWGAFLCAFCVLFCACAHLLFEAPGSRGNIFFVQTNSAATLQCCVLLHRPRHPRLPRM